MKIKLIVGTMIVLFALMPAVPAMAAKPTAFDVHVRGTWFDWYAGSMGNPFGVWTYNPWWDDWPIIMTDLTLDGNVLRKTLLYGVPVTGASTVYVYNEVSDLWIQREGEIQGPLAGLTVTEYLRGYLKFSGTPSTASFVHGVMYRWSYIYGVDEATVKGPRPYAVWDATMGAWLVGFDLYLYDSAESTHHYTTPFPSPFIEPIPASNYNPLSL